MSVRSRIAEPPSVEVAKVFGPGTPASFREGEAASQMTPASPFSPGTPIGPYDGYDRTPRSREYVTGYNIATRPRLHERVSFETLKGLINAYDISQACIWHRIDSLRSVKYRLIAADGYNGDVAGAVDIATRVLRKPDGERNFKNWFAKWMYDVLAYDAGAIYRLRNRGGRCVGLRPVDGTLIAPLLDYWGNSPKAAAPGEPEPEAYVQYVNGLPWNWLTRSDLIYEPFRTVNDSIYGRAPIESIILNANCYSDDTEVLTDRGWLRFAEVDISSDRFATRNPATAAFEWQSATRYYEADSGGIMYHAASRNADLLVTGGHRLLVDRLPRGCPGVRHGSEWLVHAEDLYEYQSSLSGGGAPVRCPATSTWSAPDLECFTLPVSPADFVRMDGDAVREARANAGFPACSLGITHPTLRRAERGERLRRTSAEAIRDSYGLPRSVIREDAHYFSGRIEGDDFAAFMGMYLSEGCVRADGPNITIAQEEFSKGYVEFRDLLARMLGREAPYHRGAFTFGHTALANYLRPFGKAHEKYIPREVLGMSGRQLEIFWHFYVLGDGAVYPHTEIVSTCSKRLADGLQEVLQKIGYSAAVRPAGRPAKPTHHQRWQVQTRRKPAYRIDVERVPCEGKVYCVSVPSKTLYVRRNGYPVWCANTDIRFQLHFLERFTSGNIPEAFASAPESWTPDQIEDWQELWDSIMFGDQSRKSQIRWMPGGSTIVWSNEKDFTDQFSLFLMRKTLAAYHLVPTDLGFTDNANYSTGESQADVQHKVGELPLMEYTEEILSQFLYDDLGLPLKFEWDRGEDQDDRLVQAQADDIYIKNGTLGTEDTREMRFGLPKSVRPVPRFVYTERGGPIPLNALMAVSGEIDPETGAPTETAPLPQAAFSGIEGALANPPLMQPPLAEEEFGPKALPPAPPLQPPPAGVPPDQEPVAKEGDGAPAAGITSETGIYGDPLIRDEDEDEDEDADAKVAKELAAFRRFERARRKNGEWRDFKFRAVSPVQAHNLNDGGRLTVRKAAGEIAVAGLAVLAADTGRVLMLQRALCDDDPAAGKFEFAGGHIEQGESPRAAATREWQEETGLNFPDGEWTGTWTSPDGIYQGFVLTVAREADLDIFARQLGSDPDGDVDGSETIAWWDPADLPGNPAVRPELLADIDAVMAALGCSTPDEGGESACPCGTPVVYDELNGWQHADGSVSHDDGESVSDKMGAVAKAADAGPKAQAWAGWRLTGKTVAYWAPLVTTAVTGTLTSATLSEIGSDYLAANPQQQGNAPGKRDRNDAAYAWLVAWLASHGLTLDASALAEGILADGYLIGTVSAAAAANGGPADLGGWKPGGTTAASARTGDLGGADALTGFLGAQAGGTADRIAGTVLAALARSLAAADGGQDPSDLAKTLTGTAADDTLSAGAVLAVLCDATAQAADDFYCGYGSSPPGLGLGDFQWVTDPALANCVICLANEAADPRPYGDTWPSGDTSTGIHEKCGCALIRA